MPKKIVAKTDNEGLNRTELESMKRVFERLDKKNDGKIDRDEIEQQLDLLGYKPKRKTDFGTSEVEDMIWEVDDDCDGKIDWDNFVHLYTRCRRDKTGCEPNRLYNLIEFMINDKDGGGTINEDEMMEVLFHRYGKDVMQRVTDEVRALHSFFTQPCVSPFVPAFPSRRGWRCRERPHIHGTPRF